MDYEEGKEYKAKGLTMKCREVEVRVRLVRILPEAEIRRYKNADGGETVFDCITESHTGVKTFDSLACLSPIE